MVLVFAGEGSKGMYDHHTVPEVEQVLAFTVSQALDGCISAGLGGTSLLGLTAGDVTIRSQMLSAQNEDHAGEAGMGDALHSQPPAPPLVLITSACVACYAIMHLCVPLFCSQTQM